MDYLFPSRTRKRLQSSSPSDTSLLDDDEEDESQSRNSNQNKRSRRLSENSSAGTHLPLLQQAQTFETSSTRSSSSSSSPLSISSSSNDLQQQQQQPTPRQQQQHNHEYYSAISAAKSRLTAAQATHTSSVSLLQHAQHQYQSSANELRNAKLFLRGVEEKWGVIMLDCDDDESYNDDIIDHQEKRPEEVIVPMLTRGGGRGQRIDRDEEGVLQPENNMIVPAATESATATDSTIEITSSGEALVNGTYYPINTTTTTSSSSSSSLIYINSSGPYHIHNQYYDVCLFPKVGYGMKFRWCLGLVPCTYHGDVGRGATGGGGDDDDGGEEEERGVGGDRTRDFALAFIYYWTMDLPVQYSSSGNNRSDGDDDDEDDQEEEEVLEYYLPLSSMQWGACHGLRPLPNISFGRKRWWQFWRA
jgi:hypothetical protein